MIFLITEFPFYLQPSSAIYSSWLQRDEWRHCHENLEHTSYCFSPLFFSCLPKCAQGLVQLEIGRLRAGSWTSSRKTSQNSQVVDGFPLDWLTCPNWEKVPHFINDCLETMCNIQHIHNTKFGVL